MELCWLWHPKLGANIEIPHLIAHSPFSTYNFKRLLLLKWFEIYDLNGTSPWQIRTILWSHFVKRLSRYSVTNMDRKIHSITFRTKSIMTSRSTMTSPIVNHWHIDWRFYLKSNNHKATVNGNWRLPAWPTISMLINKEINTCHGVTMASNTIH